MMNEGLWLYLFVLIVVAVSGFALGQLRGKANRKFDLHGKSAMEAFAYYQAKERSRHLDDVRHIDRDLRRLKERGIVPPDLPLDVWINVKGNER